MNDRAPKEIEAGHDLHIYVQFFIEFRYGWEDFTDCDHSALTSTT